ncbi:MAG: hypothetical protein AB7O62_01095 [Pirellulales bacterium]
MATQFWRWPVKCWLGGLLAAVLLCPAAGYSQQQVHVAQPFNNVSDSFFESFGFSGALSGPNWFANWGGAAAPPFGNFNPQAGASGGFGIQGRGFNGAFGFNAAQGFSRSAISQTPGLTLMNGGSGFIGDQQFSPFVLGVVPVVGNQGPWGNSVPAYPAIPWQMNYQRPVVDDEAEDAAAAKRAKKAPAARQRPIDTLKLSRGDAKPAAAEATPAAGPSVPARSVAEIRAAQQAEEAAVLAEAQELFERGQEAEAEDKLGVAKIYYQMAARRGNAELRSQIELRLKELAR